MKEEVDSQDRYKVAPPSTIEAGLRLLGIEPDFDPSTGTPSAIELLGTSVTIEDLTMHPLSEILYAINQCRVYLGQLRVLGKLKLALEDVDFVSKLEECLTRQGDGKTAREKAVLLSRTVQGFLLDKVPEPQLSDEQRQLIESLHCGIELHSRRPNPRRRGNR